MNEDYERTAPFTITKEDLLTKTSLREQRILQLAAQELSNKEIAEALAISEETAKRHRKNALMKLGVHGKKALRHLLNLLR